MLQFLHVEDSSFVILRVVAAITACILGVSFCVRQNFWQKQTSFYLFNYWHAPWSVLGVMVFIAGICLLFSKVRSLGYLLGGVVYSFLAIITGLAVISGHSDLLIIPCNLITVAVFYWSALRLSIYDKVDPDRGVRA